MRWKQSHNGKYKIPILMKIAMRTLLSITELNITYIHYSLKKVNYGIYYYAFKQIFHHSLYHFLQTIKSNLNI